MADHAINSRTKEKLVQAIRKAKKADRTKPSWNRIIDRSEISAQSWQKLTSPIGDLPGGITSINTKTLREAEAALRVTPNTLLNIVESGENK